MKKSINIGVWDYVSMVALGILVLPVVLYVCLGFMYGWAEDRTFEPQWQDCFQQANKILAAHNLCETNKACSEKSVSIYVAGYASKLPKGFNIQIYGASDPKLLNELYVVFTKKFDEALEMKHLNIQAYAFTKQEALDSAFSKEWRDGSVLDVDMQRKQ